MGLRVIAGLAMIATWPDGGWGFGARGPADDPPARLRLRSIGDLLGERFLIPRYQRGYRWTARQVKALLEDIAAFQRATRERGATAGVFYCLQPVVVRWRGGEWEVIDGQQRLTTILLILQALSNRRPARSRQL